MDNKMIKQGNELNAMVIGFISTIIFYGILFLIFSIALGNPFHRIFILLGGIWPEELCSFSLFFHSFGR